MYPNDCPSWFDCTPERKDLTTDLVLRQMIVEDENGCPALRTTSSGGGGVGGAVTLPSAVRTVTRTVDSVAGSKTVPQGARSVTIELSGDFVGSLLGDNTVVPGASYNFAVQQNDDVLGVIAYEITSGSVTITKIV